MKLKKFFSGLALIFISIILFPPSNVQASLGDKVEDRSSVTQTCYSLDLVFLIDQSDSMSRLSGSNIPPNDPLGLRISSVDWVINWLGDNVLTRCPDAVHRIAIISWGETVEVDMEPTIISPRDTAEWMSYREELKSKILVRNLGETRPDLAFTEAKRIIDSLAEQPMGELPRKRAIIFLTDGEPYFDGKLPSDRYMWDLKDKVLIDFPFDESLYQREMCLAEGRAEAVEKGVGAIDHEMLNYCLTNYPVEPDAYENSTYIFSILLNKGNIYQENVYRSIKQISESHAGTVNLLVDNDDIPSIFVDIMTNLSGIEMIKVGCVNFAVEPYLQQATLTFFKADEDINVEISYERDGTTYTLVQDDVEGITSWPFSLPGFVIKDHTVDETIERFVFDHPVGGWWNIRASVFTDCSRIQAYYEPIDISPILLEPQSVIPQYDLPPFYDEADPVYYAYQLANRDGSGEPLSLDPLYPLILSVAIVHPDGKQEIQELVYDSDRKVYRSVEPVLVSTPGRYEFTTTATTRYVDSEITEPRILFVDGPRTYEVLTVEPFVFLITKPMPGETLRLHDNFPRYDLLPFSFAIQISRRGGGDMDSALVFPDTSMAFSGQITTSSGEIVGTVNFIPNPSNPGEFTVRTDMSIEEGTYQLTVLVGEYNAQYHPDNSTASVVFTVKDNLASDPDVPKIIGIILGVLLLAVIIIIILNRTHPVTGSLIFELGTAEVAEVPISSGWNVTTRKRSTLDPQLGLKLLKARRSRSNLGAVEYFAVDNSNNKYNDELFPNNPRQFTGGMTIRYEPLVQSSDYEQSN